MIERTFQPVDKEAVNKADQQSFLVSLGWSRGITWEELLKSKRVLIISEAGAGKTFECRSQLKRLQNEGAPAFFVELAALVNDDLRSLLDIEEEAKFDAWLSSQSDIATFFLDSIDELKLTLGSFERALKRFRKCIGNQLHRVKIVITTRPIKFDEQIVRSILPVPKTIDAQPSEESFANTAMGNSPEKSPDNGKNTSPDWRLVALMPLSDEQIVKFAQGQGVNDPNKLLEDLRRRNAQEFARRPQDLLELSTDWLEHNRIRTHCEQVQTNIRIKLAPREDRPEPAHLSLDKAVDGASRLALAMLMMRRLTLRHSQEADEVNQEAALNPSKILSDWQPNEIKALLERPLFGFASYGRVRFHHRSVLEFLASERLSTLRERGMSFKALKRTIFADNKNEIIVNPSRRAVAGWLALKEQGVFELLRDNEPYVLLSEGDPESLSLNQRSQALNAFCKRYGPGGWRGLRVPDIQIFRFASQELHSIINKVWQDGVENPDVREVLIDLIGAGRIEACSDIAFDTAQNLNATTTERTVAIHALIELRDGRLKEIAASVAAADKHWTETIARSVVVNLFPEHMTVEQLCSSLKWIKPEKRSVANLSWQMPRVITSAELDLQALQELRDGLVSLLSHGLKWTKEWPHVVSTYQHLSPLLVATCQRGLADVRDEMWFKACAMSLRLYDRDFDDRESSKSLRETLMHLEPEDNELFFWTVDAFNQSIKVNNDAWQRLTWISFHEGPVQLKAERDLTWVCDALSDERRDVLDREMLLEVAIQLAPDWNERRKHAAGLKPIVKDVPSLVCRIDDWQQPSNYQKQQEKWEKKAAARKKQEERRNAKAQASWIQFWREVANQPDRAFSTDNSWNTAWNLWRAMKNDGDGSRNEGWNRRFIEKHFSVDTADRLRRTLMRVWRDDLLSLPSERTEEERNVGLVRWQLGLAAIYAEAEDLSWAKKINSDEAKLAARFALVELNGFPNWMSALVDAHADSVDEILGNELTWELSMNPSPQGYSRLLQDVCNATEDVVQLFLPRLRTWFDTAGDKCELHEHLPGLIERVRKVSRAFLEHGRESDLKMLRDLSVQRLEQTLPDALRLIWLSNLIRIDPHEGVKRLHQELSCVQPAEQSKAVSWLACIFGGRQDTIDLKDTRFTPQSLLKLMRIAYRHVRIQDDAHHEGSYTPDTRDDAEQARNNIVTALFDAKGESGLSAKLEMARDPLCAHFKDRILAVAQEKWAEELDTEVFNEAQAVALDRFGESPVLTNRVMYAVLKDRLSDLNELLLQDISPREAWAGISDERVMRREIARELLHAANHIYTVDQEAVTADEKETDIRLRSTASNNEAVIELKLADRRTARDLRDTIENQLVKKYMASDSCKSGALLITLKEDRGWKHPDNGKSINVEGLMKLLHQEAERVQNSLGGNIYLTAHLLDLRPRLPKEKNK